APSGSWMSLPVIGPRGAWANHESPVCCGLARRDDGGVLEHEQQQTMSHKPRSRPSFWCRKAASIARSSRRNGLRPRSGFRRRGQRLHDRLVELLQIRFEVAGDERVDRAETHPPLKEAAHLLPPAFGEGRVRLCLIGELAQ